MNKVAKIVGTSLLVLSLTGCGTKIPKLENGKDALITFTDSEKNISVDDLYSKLKNTYGTNYIIEMIDKSLLNDLYPRDEKAEIYLNGQIEVYAKSYGSQESLLNALQQYGYNTIDEFKDYLFLNYQRESATKDYVKENLTDSEIEKYYEKNIFGDMTVSHILIKVETNDSMTDEEKEEANKAAMEKINNIYSALDAGEKTFAELAEEYSDDEATKNVGGKLEPFNVGEMTKNFEDACKDLKVGEYLKNAVQTEYGYHIILKEDEKEKPALKEVKAKVIDLIIDEKMSDDTKLQYKALMALREKNGVTITDKDLKDNYDKMMDNYLYGDNE